MLSKYTNIIWDWNGTLLDDVDLCVDVINGMLARRSLQIIDTERYQEIFCFPIYRYYEKLGFDFNFESFDSLAMEYVSEFDERSKKCNLHIGTLQILEYLKSKKYSQFILSAHEHNSLIDVLESHQINTFFEGVYGIEDCMGTTKIHQGMRLLEEHQLLKTETVLVGDTEHDLEVANELGINCILVSNGHHSDFRLRGKHDLVFPTIKEVVYI